MSTKKDVDILDLSCKISKNKLKSILMKKNCESIEFTKKSYKKLAIIVSIFLIISSSIYLVSQFLITNKISDVLFVSLTLFESLFVLYSGSLMIKYLESKGLAFYTSLNYFNDPESPKKEINRLICIFQHYSKSWVFILLWSICMGILPYFQGYWANNLSLSILFGAFLFFTNIITSYFVILLFFFFIRTKKLWSLIKVELWNRENPAAKFIFSVSKWVALIATVYMTSSITAWNTSEKITPFGNEIILFLVFSVALLIASIVVPIFPFIKKISELKNNALCEIDCNIQTEYSELLKDFKNDGNKVKFEKMNGLIEMRKRIESIQIYPFQLKTFIAAISIILISLIPKIIEIILIEVFK
jgi:hypothetical protein